ncbi:MAG: hypothetical protein LH618_06025, partial [Saprospiraceae bacterium]|nr:hypothetical protein [Saprospiraceae bacterium]
FCNFAYLLKFLIIDKNSAVVDNESTTAEFLEIAFIFQLKKRDAATLQLPIAFLNYCFTNSTYPVRD